jgi:pimeloyl-ACP methyl ester carboxylesterase
MRETRLRRGDVEIHVVEWQPAEAASEPPVLLLHGLSSNSYFWSRIAERLPWRRVVAIDQRAHGASSAPATGYEPAELAADAAYVIEQLELERPVVAGHSWGASIALQLGSDRPELSGGLVIIDGPVTPMSERLTWEEAQRIMQPPLPVYADVSEAVAERKRYIGHVWGADLDRFVEHGLVRDGDGWRLPLTEKIRFEILRAMFFQDYLRQWPRVRGPILLALAIGTGADSFYEFKKAGSEALKRERPDIVVHWYRTYHDIPVEDPDGLAADIERTALRAGFADLSGGVSGLAGDWAAPAGYAESGDGAWTAKDLLAHLSSTEAALPTMITADPASRDPSRVPFDPDRWNASMIRRRREELPAALIGEFRDATQRLDELLAELQLEKPIGMGRVSGSPKGDGLRYMHRHQRAHFADLKAALAGKPES